MLKDLAVFHREGVQSDIRTVRGTFFQSVADWNVGKAWFLRIALVKTQYTCPDARVIRKECMYITPSDLASAAKTRKPDIASAEIVLQRFRELCSGPEWEKLSAVQRVQFLSKLDVTVGRWLMGKNKDLPEKFPGVSHIVGHVLDWGKAMWSFQNEALINFHRELTASAESAQGDAASAKPAQGDAASAKSKAAPQLLQLQELSAVNAATTLRQHMLEIGMPVVDKKGKVVNIVSTRDDVVLYRGEAASAESPLREMDAEKFVAMYDAHKPSQVVHQGWPLCLPSKNSDHKTAILKSHTILALQQASAAVPQGLETKLLVMTKPKGVMAAHQISKGSLCLVPETAKIQVLSAEAKVSSSSEAHLQVTFDKLIHDGARVFLQPNTAADFVCPAWHVEACTNKASANMQWTTMTVNLYSIVEMVEGVKQPSGKKGKDPATNTKVTVPVLTNHKEIKKGDHLCFFQEKSAPTKRFTLSVGSVVGQAIKKTRT